LNQIDSVFYNRLKQLERGKFEETLAEIRNESGQLLKTRDFGQDAASSKRALCNAKILTLGLSGDRKLSEELLACLAAGSNVWYKYEYAKYLIEYKPVEKYSKIVSLLETDALKRQPVHIAVKILQLLRNVYLTGGEKEKSLAVNKRIISMLKDISGLDEFTEWNYCEVLNFTGEIDNMFTVSSLIRSMKESGETQKLRLLNSMSIVKYFTVSRIKEKEQKRVEIIFRQHIKYLQDMYSQSEVLLTDGEKIGLLITLCSYYAGCAEFKKDKDTVYTYVDRENSFRIDVPRSRKYYRAELLRISEEKMKMYPEVEDYKTLFLANFFSFMGGSYSPGKETHEKAIRLISEMQHPGYFAHYQAIGYFYAFLNDITQPAQNSHITHRLDDSALNSYGMIIHYNMDDIKNAYEIWDRLVRQFPDTRLYRTNRNVMSQLLLFNRK
jgi:tetratricopeptide (TPR) repeat protein